MLERLVNDEEGLKDHELLEILLFNAIPRKNTNEIAHALLDKFGGLAALSRADIPAMTTVEGVGESTAAYLRCFFLLMDRIRLEPSEGFPSAQSFGAFSTFLVSRLRGRSTECIELYATDKTGNIIGVQTFPSKERDRAAIGGSAVAKFFAKYSPKALVVAHNHPIGGSRPSEIDDRFTRRMQCICSLHSIPLLDHIIVGPKDVYSYYCDHRLEKIKQTITADDVIETLAVTPLSSQ